MSEGAKNAIANRIVKYLNMILDEMYKDNLFMTKRYDDLFMLKCNFCNKHNIDPLNIGFCYWSDNRFGKIVDVWMRLYVV